MSSNKKETSWGAIFIVIVVISVLYGHYKSVRKDCVSDAVRAGYSWSKADDMCSECWTCDRR